MPDADAASPGAATHGRAAGARAERQRAAVVAAHFAGDAQLHAAFAAACDQQFAVDAPAGDRFAAGGDLASLGRLAHNLHSALTMLGHRRAGGHAARVEQHCAAGSLPRSRSAWKRLREHWPEHPA